MAFGKLGQTFSALEIYQIVKDDLKSVEEEIRLESIASIDTISAITKHLHAGGGKRLRPTLLLLACRLFGKPGETAFRLGAVVEMVHTATLVHDDVIDVAETRRGRASTNMLWGNHTSVLAGDWLYMQAFQMALKERNFRVLDLLISLTQLMVEGEVLQLERIGKLSVSEADYMDLVDRKTASLFSVCARLGAIVGGANEEEESRLGNFAWNLGMAFQLVDDILDFTASESVLRKPVGSDLREGKITLPLIYALENATPIEKQAVEAVLRSSDYAEISFERIFEFTSSQKGIERARKRAEVFADAARKIISSFPDSNVQRALAAISELVTERDH